MRYVVSHKGPGAVFGAGQREIETFVRLLSPFHDDAGVPNGGEKAMKTPAVKILLCSVVVMMALSLGASAAVNGAIQTTDVTGTIVNYNVNPPLGCDQVYLTGGPQNTNDFGIALRLQADEVHTRFLSGTQDHFRFSAGMVFRF